MRLRTLNLQSGTEPRVRVPGIRLPKLIERVEESRIWREREMDTGYTMSWRGSSLYTFSGFEIFEVHDFPFDRQVINLEVFEFVWGKDRDVASFEEMMKVVSFSVETTSMMPEWDTYPAIVEPMNIKHPVGGPSAGPSYCTMFTVKIRMERKPTYYVAQIFFVTSLILITSLLPLALEATVEHIGDRLALHAAGLLTLVTFKYTVVGYLPAVPYTTFTNRFLNAQILCVVLVACWSLMAFKLTSKKVVSNSVVNAFEDVILTSLVSLWVCVLGYIVLIKTSKPWEQVLSEQENTFELDEDHVENTAFTGRILDGVPLGKPQVLNQVLEMPGRIWDKSMRNLPHLSSRSRL